jgi:hypothetical protein
MFKKRPSPSAAIAVLALFVALGGSAFAAKSYVITRPGQIKPSVLRRLRGPRGPVGPQGPGGPQGPVGPVAIAAATEVVGPSNVLLPGTAESSTATCPAGSRVISGGGSAITGDANGIAASEPTADHLSWFVVGGNTSGVDGSVQAIAYCAPSGQAVASSTGAAHARAQRAADAVARRVAQAIRAGR